MYFFKNDYDDICVPEVLDALRDAIDEKNIGYGFDTHTENATRLIKEALKDDNVEIHFVPGGVSANILSITTGLRQAESVISATTGHIEIHEAGAIEATGVRIETISTDDGKLTVESIKRKLDTFGPEYMTVPRIVYISNTTEVGSVYNKKEIEDIYQFCKENDLYLFIDGARMAIALACEDSNLKLEDLTRICDVFTLGGTKNGLLFSEAVVIRNDELKKNFINLKKQKGAMLSKGFVPAIMYETLFQREGGYLKGAIHAQNMAKRLAEGLQNKNIPLFQKFESNQVFIVRNDEQVKELEKIAQFDVTFMTDEGDSVVRFVTTYRTTEEEVDGLLKDIEA